MHFSSPRDQQAEMLQNIENSKRKHKVLPQRSPEKTNVLFHEGGVKNATATFRLVSEIFFQSGRSDVRDNLERNAPRNSYADVTNDVAKLYRDGSDHGLGNLN